MKSFLTSGKTLYKGCIVVQKLSSHFTWTILIHKFKHFNIEKYLVFKSEINFIVSHSCYETTKEEGIHSRSWTDEVTEDQIHP